MKATTTILTLIMAAGLASVAHAQDYIPEGCEGRGARGYVSGHRSGVGTVNRVWDALRNDCDEIDRFTMILERNLGDLEIGARERRMIQRDPERYEYLVCRYTGLVDGVWFQLDELSWQCDEQCFMEGWMIGEMAASVYCELSLALGGLAQADRFIRGPVRTCGFNFQSGCDTAFEVTSFGYANDLGACQPYTEGEFYDVWEETQNNQCIYPEYLTGSGPDSESEEEPGF